MIRTTGTTRSQTIARWLRRLVLFTILWWIVAEGRGGGWPIALLAVLGSTWLSLRLLPEGIRGMDPVRILRFLPYFLKQALLGGVDVASRALRPSGPVDPILIEYPLRLTGDSRVLLTNIVSLLPGTVSVKLMEDRLRVHVIDASLPALRKIRELESRVARLADLDLGDDR